MWQRHRASRLQRICRRSSRLDEIGPGSSVRRRGKWDHLLPRHLLERIRTVAGLISGIWLKVYGRTPRTNTEWSRSDLGSTGSRTHGSDIAKMDVRVVSGTRQPFCHHFITTPLAAGSGFSYFSPYESLICCSCANALIIFPGVGMNSILRHPVPVPKCGSLEFI